VKTLILTIAAASLTIPAAASAQRITTPGTFDRHAENLEQAEAKLGEESQRQRMAETGREHDADRVPAAKAGKVNVSSGVTN
jgi:hypothetical protein